MGSVILPNEIKLSSRLEDNSIECVRQRLRRNLINHLVFDPSLESKSG
jgi:hypothetical protein